LFHPEQAVNFRQQMLAPQKVVQFSKVLPLVQSPKIIFG
jgi:hypothetical protein